MKNSIKSTVCKFGLILFLMMFSISGKAQTPYTMSMTASAPTDKTIDVTLSITANTAQRFGGFSAGINFNSAIINGGTISAAYVPNSKATELANLTVATPNVATVGHVRLSVQTLTGANGVDMAQGTTLVLGTYKITNTVAWAQNTNAALWLQNVLATGKTNSLVNGYPFGVTTPAVSNTTTAPTLSPGLTLGFTQASPLSLGLNSFCGITAQPVNPTICKAVGGTASVSVTATGTAGASYQWYTQTAIGNTWTALTNNANYSGVTSATLNITRTTTAVPPTGTKYRVIINGGVCSNVTSDVVTLQEQTVLSKAAAITAKSSTNATLSPANTTCQGSSVNLTLAAGSIGNLQWQSSTDGINYSNVGSVITQSALSAVNPLQTLSSGVLTQDTWFRVVASNGICSSVNGVATKITVSLPAVAGTITGGDVTVCGYLPIGTTALDVTGAPLSTTGITNSTVLTLNGNTGSVVWQKSINYVNTTSAAPIWAAVTTGIVGNQLTATNLTADTWYRALVTNGACSTTTAVTKITVNKVAKAGVTTATTNNVVTTSVCAGGDITFTSAAYTGTAIQWEVSTTSATTGFTAVSGENGLVFTMNDVSYAPLSKFYVRSVVTSGNCTLARSAVKTITVNPLSVAGTVTGGGTVCTNSSATVKVAGNTGTIKWEYSLDGTNYLAVPYWKTVSFVPTLFNPSNTTEFTTTASTGIAATYVFTNLTSNVYFRAKITSGACSSSYTNPVYYQIGTAAVAGTISAASTTICPATGTTLSVSGAVGTITWQKSTNWTTALPTWTAVANSNVTTLPTGNLTVSTAYRTVVTIGSCSTETSANAVVEVVAKPIAKPVTANVTSPAGSLAAPLCTSSTSKILTIGAGYSGTIQWQTSTTSTTTGFSNISGATGTTYTISNPAVGANYYRASFTNSCSTVVYSAAVTVYYQSCGARTEDQVEKVPFAVVAYPNPYSENFSLSLTTTSEENVSVMVYDMTGRLVEKQEVSTAAIAELQVGNRYPSGIYNVIITQGSEVKTLRVVKR